jgi:hypothetical protein
MIKQKRIIFIASTSYSGSTLIDKILSNTPQGISAGEVISIWSPWKGKHSRQIVEGIGYFQNEYNSSSDYAEFCEKIFENNNNIEYIVDSSKNIRWIQEQSLNLQKRGFICSLVCIYKTPLEYMASYKKRGKRMDLKRWTNYYLQTLRVFNDVYYIEYKDLVSDDSGLKFLCNEIGLPYLDSMREYWKDSRNSTIYGNNNTLNSMDAESFNNDTIYREIRYTSSVEDNLRSMYPKMRYYTDAEKILEIMRNRRYLDDRDVVDQLKHISIISELRFLWTTYVNRLF